MLRLDGDFYKSTMDGLQILYPKLSPGGFCIVDDYYAFPVRARLARSLSPAFDRCGHERGVITSLRIMLSRRGGGTQECERACTEYREAHGITAEIVPIDDEGEYWRALHG